MLDDFFNRGQSKRNILSIIRGCIFSLSINEIRITCVIYQQKTV